MQKILLASNNKHKAEEFIQIFEKEKIKLEILIILEETAHICNISGLYYMGYLTTEYYSFNN